jgi:hypothetical protein
LAQLIPKPRFFYTIRYKSSGRIAVGSIRYRETQKLFLKMITHIPDRISTLDLSKLWLRAALQQLQPEIQPEATEPETQTEIELESED